jgi:hypothetical protein
MNFWTEEMDTQSPWHCFPIQWVFPICSFCICRFNQTRIKNIWPPQKTGERKKLQFKNFIINHFCILFT